MGSEVRRDFARWPALLLWSGTGRPASRRIRSLLLVGAGWYAGARLGHALMPEPASAPALWPAGAVLLAAYLLVSVRDWPWLTLAALVAHAAAHAGADTTWPMLLTRFGITALANAVAARCVLQHVRLPVRLDRLRSAAVLLLCAGLIAPLLTVFLELTLTSLHERGLRAARAYLLRDVASYVLAYVTVTPAILAWSAHGLSPLRGRPPGFGPTGASTISLLLALLTLALVLRGAAPFGATSSQSVLLAIQLQLVILSAALVLLGAVAHERRLALRTARQSRAHLDLALDAAQLATWDWPLPRAPDPGVGLAERASRPSGGPAANLLEGVHPLDRAAVERSLTQALERTEAYETEFRVIERDGTIGWRLAKGRVLSDASDGPVRFIGIHADITERKATERLNSAENRILAMIAAGAPLQETLTRLVELVEAEATELVCSVLLLDEDRVHIRHGAAPSLPETYTAAIDGLAIGPRAGSCGTAMYLGRPVIVTDLLRDPLWSEYYELAIAHGLRACWSTPIHSPAGAVLGSFAMYYRVPRGPTPSERKLLAFATQLATIALERHRVESESERQRRELAHLGRVAALGGLSGALAHELSQPLTAILSNAQTAIRLLRTGDRVADLHAILEDIVAADCRAAEVIERLRSMLQNRRRVLEPLNLNDVVTDTLRIAHTDLVRRQVGTSVDLESDMPLILGDEVQLQQVLLNLVLNACEAMCDVPPAERRLEIATRRHYAAAIEVSIADRGPGIAAPLIDRIFEPFVTSKPDGLGLGLSIAHSIMLAHGGRITSENRVGRGAIFHLVLPALVDATAADA